MEWLPTIRYPYKSAEAQESKGSVKLNYRDLVVFVQALIYDVFTMYTIFMYKNKIAINILFMFRSNYALRMGSFSIITRA